MDSLGVIFLGVIAFSSLVQGVFLIVLARGGVRMARRMDDLQGRLERELRPSVENLHRISRNLAEVSDLTAFQARRVEVFVAGAADRLDETAGRLRELALRPLGAAGTAVAFLRGVRRGVQVYRQLGSLEVQERGRARRYEGDEHLFI